MRSVIPEPPRPSLPIAGAEARFPVRRIYCVGRNFHDHVREMGEDVREAPFFFTKPADALTGDGTDLHYPPATGNLHHEGELVVAIGVGGADIRAADGLSHVWGYAPGNDLTRRDLQAQAKAKRRPWDMAKGFDGSAVCGALVAASEIGHPVEGRLTVTVNGEPRQDGEIAEMIWAVPDILAHLSTLVTLAPGDLVYCGTPQGVGALERGDICTVAIHGIGQVTTRIV